MRKTINNLYRLGATVIHGTDGQAHVSGHASQEELLLMLNLVRPEHFVPVHGEYRMLVRARKLAERTGVERRERAPGRKRRRARVHGASAATRSARRTAATSFVDGSGVGDVGEAVLRDRKPLSADGIMMVVVTVDSEEARVIAGPDLISRGVFYLPEADGVLDELRGELRSTIEGISVDGMRDVETVKEHIRSGLAGAVYARTRRRPIVIPVVMEV